MATTNLTERTLGSIVLSSGNGTPDHSANTGTLYTNEDNANTYINNSAGGLGTNWIVKLRTNWRGSMVFADNAVSVETFLGWQEFSLSGFFNQTMGTNVNSGITLDSGPNDYRLNVDNAGTYMIFASCTLKFIGAANGDYQFGISINSSVPNLDSTSAQRINNDINSTASFDALTVESLALNDKISIAFNTGGQAFIPINCTVLVIEV